MSYFFILFFTIYVATRKDIIYENITGVSTAPEYRILVIIYTLISAIYFAYQMNRHFHYLNRYPRYIPTLIFLAALFMCIGAFCPYSKDNSWLSSIHVYASITASLLFIIILQIYTHQLSIQCPAIYFQTHWLFHLGLQILVVIFFVSGAINGIIEILYVLIICFYLFSIDRQMKKSKSHDLLN